MYADTTIVFKGPKFDDVKKAHPAGVCASFTFDWIKKVLAKKVCNESTYESSGRLRKLVRRQNKYENSEGDLTVLAKSYGLEILQGSAIRADDIKPAIFKPDSSCYYISMQLQQGPQHAIGFDRSTNLFCDANFGIMKLNTRTIDSIILECWDALAELNDGTKSVFWVYPVKLIPAK